MIPRKETFVIDGNNVCWWYSQAYPNELSALPLFFLLVELLAHGDDFYCVFDASICHLLADNGQKEHAAAVELCINKHPKRFFRVTASTRADGVILHDADHHNRRIVTNDTYRDYSDRYAWLQDKYTSRLIQGNFQQSGLLTLDKVPYGHFQVSREFEAISKRLHELLEIPESTQLTELNKQIILRRDELLGLQHKIEEEDRILTQKKIETKGYYNLKAEIVGLSLDLDRLNNDISGLRDERDRIQKDLSKLSNIQNFNIEDFEKVIQEHKSELEQLTNQQEAVKQQVSQEVNTLNNLKRQAEKYLSIVEEKRREEAIKQNELSDERLCISKANKALKDFLAPYGYSSLEFKGTTWNHAVRALGITFEKTPICPHCFELSTYHRVGEKCHYCHKASTTDNPHELWAIVNKYSPKQSL